MPTPADILAYDPGIDKNGKVIRGGIPNPRPAEAKTNPSIQPTTALYRAAAGYDLALELLAEVKALRAEVAQLAAEKRPQ